MGLARFLTQARLTRAVTVALALALLAGGAPLLGWNQKTHRQINFEATNVFFERATEEGIEKYRLGPISSEGRTALHRGIAVNSSTLFIKPAGGVDEAYQLGEERHAMAAWISLGGDWADEPHLYASVRHFYDPLKVAGVAYLTDQYWAHGNYDSPAIDAVTWALDHPDNPFCLKQGMVAYKLALETPDDLPPPPALGATHFKTNLSLTAKDAVEQRSLYLARAYRALGETMHMIGDMTQPAHVRNDSHPMDEPIETSTFSSDVRLASANPLVDSRAQPFLASAGGVLQSPRGLSHQLALFTNHHFYSMDTIHDLPSLTMPSNRMPPYSSPQFTDLVVRTATIRGFIGKRKVKKLFARIAGRDVPMAQERLSFHWFDPDHSLIHGSKLETIGRATSILANNAEAMGTGPRLPGKLGAFMIPSAFAREQATVLLPLAIHACADLMDLFFPTLELQVTCRPEGLVGGAGGSQETPGPQVIAIEPAMVHHRERDPAWKAFGLSIEYTGPGALVITRDGEVEATRKLHFKKGKLETIETSAGKMVEAPLQVFVPSGRGALSGDQEFYAFERGQKLHLEIEAGSRRFESPPYELEHEVVIMPRMAIGPPGATFDFEASARPEGHYRFEWEWPGVSEAVATEGSTSEVAPVLSEEGEYPFTVKLVHGDGTVLAEDRVTAYVEEEDDEVPTPVPTPKPEPGRWALVRQWNTVWKDTRSSSSSVTAEAGVNSARIHVTVPDLSTTFHFDYAMSWSALPASLAPRETFEVILRLDTLDLPELGVGWGVQIGVYSGWVETLGGDDPPPEAGFAGTQRGNAKWDGFFKSGYGAKDKKPPYSETVEQGLQINPEDGDVQVVTVRVFAHGAGGGGKSAAIHFHYEYRFQQ